MIWLDTETFSTTPIKHGTYRYTSNAEVLIVTYAFADDDPVQLWDVTAGRKMPGDLEHFLLDTDELITAHNAIFDRLMMTCSRNMRIKINQDRWRCTMAQAYAHGLPGALDKLCEILRVPVDQAKVKNGRALIRLFTMPQPKNRKIERATWYTHPKEWSDFCDYAKHDISAMRVCQRTMPAWNYRGSELELWQRDQRINDRGFLVDVDFARAALRAVDRSQKRLAAETVDATDGQVASATQRDQLIAYILQEYGVDLPDMQSATIERRMRDPDLPDELKELLAIRVESTQTSNSKYNSLLRGVSADDRLRGTKQFCGAGRTGRWAGRTFQPDNLPRPDGTPQEEIDEFIDAARNNFEDLVTEKVTFMASKAIRGTIIAPPGKKLVVGDLSNIEGRKAAWLAGEEWKLQSFREFDAGRGVDSYIAAYARAFRIAVEEVTKSQRQVGKVMELMLQYEGGVGAFVTGAATYGVDLEALAVVAKPHIPREIWKEAEGFLEWTKKKKRATFGLSDDAFIVCDSLKRMWRLAHPRITSYWPELKEAAINAIATPGSTFEARMLKFQVDGSWLRVRLPSGRYLCYPSPRLKEIRDGADCEISYLGLNQYTRAWQRLKIYGGKFLENVTQAAARDVLVAPWETIEENGYAIVLHVHDENVCEVPDMREWNIKQLCELMCAPISWAEGLPLAAAGFETYRYRKE